MIILPASYKLDETQEGSSISRQHLNENLEILHLAPTLFYHLPGFYLKTGFINPHPLSLDETYEFTLIWSKLTFSKLISCLNLLFIKLVKDKNVIG